MVPPGSRLPAEGEQELLLSGLLNFPAGGSTVCTDGPHAWPKVVKSKAFRLKSRQVSHRKGQFTLKSGKGKVWGGTQCLDRAWSHLKKWSRVTGAPVKDRTTSHAHARVWNMPLAWVYLHNRKCLGKPLPESVAWAWWKYS